MEKWKLEEILNSFKDLDEQREDIKGKIDDLQEEIYNHNSEVDEVEAALDEMISDIQKQRLDDIT